MASRIDEAAATLQDEDVQVESWFTCLSATAIPTAIMPYRRTENVVRRLAARHAAIIAAARDTASEGGMAAVQIAPVAERAGIAAGTVYRYFPAKTDLVAALVAAVSDHGLTAVNVVMVRGGRHVGDRTFFPQHAENATLEEVVTAFLMQHYVDRSAPPTIIAPEGGDDPVLAEVLSEQSGHKVQIVSNPGGERRVWVAMAVQNATLAIGQKLAQQPGRPVEILYVAIEGCKPVSAFAVEAMPGVVEQEHVILAQAGDRPGNFVFQSRQRRVFVEARVQFDRLAGKHGFQHIGECFGVTPGIVDRLDAAGLAVVFQADDVRHDAAARG